MKQRQLVALGLLVMMLVSCMGAVTFAADAAYYDIALSAPITAGGEASLIVTKTEVTGTDKTVTAVTEGVSFTSSDPEVIAVENGKAFGKAVGKAQITATVEGNAVASMLGVVGSAVVKQTNYDGEELGKHTERLTSLQDNKVKLDAPYEYVSDIAHGNAGKSLYLGNITVEETFENQHWMRKNDFFADNGAVPGDTVTEFWFYYDGYADSRTFQFWTHGNFKKGADTTYFRAVYQFRDGCFSVTDQGSKVTAGYATGYNGNGIPMKRGWNQVVIEGIGEQYTYYVNGVHYCQYAAPGYEVSGFTGLTFDRFASAANPNHYLWLDDYAVYEMAIPAKAPSISDAKITGRAISGSTLSGSYAYDPGTKELYQETDSSVYAWKISAEKNGTYTAMDGQTGNTLTLTDDMVGKYVKFFVTLGEVTIESEGVLVSEKPGSLIYNGQPVRIEIASSEHTGFAVGQPASITVTAVDSQGATKIVTEGVTYTSSNPGALSVDRSGAVTAAHPGISKVTASYEGYSASMLGVVYQELKNQNLYNETPDGEKTEKLTSEQDKNLQLEAPFEYVETPVHGAGGSALFLNNITVPADFQNTHYMRKNDLFPGQGALAGGEISEFWFYYDGYSDSRTLQFWTQGLLSEDGKTYFRAIMQFKNGKFSIAKQSGSVEATYAMGLSEEGVTMNRGWNQLVTDGSGDGYDYYVNGSLYCSFRAGGGTKTYGITANVFDRFATAQNQNHYIWIDDYASYNIDSAPYVYGAEIIGKPEPGVVLNGSYEYMSGIGEQRQNADQSTYQWMIASQEDGTYTAIVSATDKTYAPTQEQVGSYLRFDVTLGGVTISSRPVKIVEKGATVAPAALYVALDGNDQDDGSKDAPFATLEAARDAIRKYRRAEMIPKGGITVYLRAGTYHLKKAFMLDFEDVATEDKPVTYTAYPGEEVTISGGLELDYSKFKPVEGEMKDKLRSADAQGKVLAAKLSDLGMSIPGQYSLQGNAYVAPMFLYKGQVLDLARYPNSDSITDWPGCDILNRGYCTRYPKNDWRQGEGLMKVQYTDPVIDGWKHNLGDVFFSGYWGTEWYGEYVSMNIDQTAHTLEAKGNTIYGGIVGGKDRRFRAYNVYEEIDQPGEWYIDRSTGMMYLYPLDDGTDADLRTTSLDQNLIISGGAAYTTFKGLTVTGGRKNGFQISGSDHVVISDCDINSFEEKAVLLEGGTNNGVLNCHIHHTGTGGVLVTGSGDVDTLTSGESYVTNCEINDFSLLSSYGLGIQLVDSIGFLIDHNEFYNCPYAAIRFQGSLNVMEYNKFHHAVLNTADMGAIYTGRDWRDHGNVIRYNHFSHLGADTDVGLRPCGVFTDDGSSDLDVYGNVFGTGLDFAQANKVHAGQNNAFYNNVYIDCPWVFYAYMWKNAKWIEYITGKSEPTGYRDLLEQVCHNPLYVEKWPWLGNVDDPKTIHNLSNTLRDNLIIYVKNQPRSGSVSESVTYHSDDPALKLYGWQDQQTNTILLNQSKDIFADYDNEDFTLDPSVYPEGFPEIPFDQIGRIDPGKLQEWLDQAILLKDGAKIGTTIGTYPQENADELQGAITAAEHAAGKNADEILQAIKGLQEAIRSFRDSFILEDQATGSYSLPGGVEGAVLHTGDVEGGFTLKVDGTFGKTTLMGTLGEQEYQVEFSSGTAVNPADIKLSGARINSTGTELTNQLVWKLGGAGQFSKPVRTVWKGLGDRKVFVVNGAQLTPVKRMSEDSAEGLAGQTVGYLAADGDLILWQSGGEEVVTGGKLIVSPSTEPTATPGNSESSGGYIPPSGGTGSGSVGGGTKPTAPSTPDPAKSSPFGDIIGHWAQKEITAMYERKIVSGVTADSFEPDRPITRAEFATLVAKSLNLTSEVPAGFTDVVEGAWYAPYVNAAANAGLISGYAGQFRPEDMITREEMAVIVVKTHQFRGGKTESGKLSAFTDRDQISDWAAEYADIAVSTGFISGLTDTTFAPKEQATRAQVTAVLYRILQ